MPSPRNARLIGLVAGAHFMSHFFQLSLPPLFPVLREAFGISYLALGVVATVFYAASGVGQAMAGFVVDRVGARPILLGGLSLLAGAVLLAGLAPSFEILILVLLLAGIGNSVFHPADYSILNARVDRRWLGRAYSAHSIAGNLGWVAPMQTPIMAITGATHRGPRAPAASSPRNPAAAHSPLDATRSCRVARSASSPPTRIPPELPSRKAVRALVAALSGTP